MIINEKYDTTRASTWEYRGTSSEVKPTVANGAKEIPPDMSIFVEFDTGEAYYYNKANDVWMIIGG